MTSKQDNTIQPDDLLKLDNQLCFALYTASKEITKMYRPMLEKLQLTYPQYITLLALWETDNLTVKELGQRLSLDSGTLTPMLKRMEQQQLIERKRGAQDERQVFITLTPKGHELKSTASCIPAELVNKASSAHIPVDSLMRSIQELTAHLRRLHDAATE
ncbi:MarR family winged helix-turn-helix transcriptional regulator [Paenibacillus alvei]|uniref:MarR family winged helix-turn-helix transcriptional regulator n=1 Tax=Paenibacillus alvei TaxID=44250 RepID=UPI0013DC29D2|nr:MarR family transcriptional regulator [Paenibacillus alvei]NEZ40554.1 MarR family transcriptional regulator [Paenibacillus alvei]